MPYKDIVKKNKEKGYKYPLLTIEDEEVIEIQSIKINSADETHYIYQKGSTVSKRVEVTETYVDIITNEVKYLLEYTTTTGTKNEVVVDSLQISDANKIIELAKLGIDVNSINAKKLVMHLNNQTIEAKRRPSTSGIGFVDISNKRTIFVGNRIFTYRNGKFYKSSIKYDGNIKFKHKGERTETIKMINNIIENNPNLSLALTMGVSALIVGYMRNVGIIQPNIIVHLSGDSSTGKSTALKMAVSLFGDINGGNSLFASWNSTDNAIQEMLANNYGIPIALDEAGMMKNKKHSALIYALAQGKEKQRLYFGRGNTEVRTWNTVIISSGEVPIDNDDSDQATGVGVRLIKLDGVQWTSSAEEADKVLRFVSNNYGVVGYHAAYSIIKKGIDKLVSMHSNEYQIILEILDDTKFKSRLANTIAIFSIASIILKEIGISVDTKFIREMICSSVNEQHNKKSSLGERAFEAIKSEILRNTSKLDRRLRNGKSIIPNLGDCVGIAYGTGPNIDKFEVKEIALDKKYLETTLKQLGFSNTTEVLRQWKANNKLKLNNKNGIIHKIKISGISVDTIKIINDGGFNDKDKLS